MTLPTPENLEVICTKGLSDDEILDLIAQKQTEGLPDTTLVILTRTPIDATLHPATANKPAYIDVKVNKSNATLIAIDDLLGYFHKLSEVYTTLDVEFEIVGGNEFETILSKYDTPATEEEVEEFLAKQSVRTE